MMNLLGAWRILRLSRALEDSDSLACGSEGYEEYGMERWPSLSAWIVECRLTNWISVGNEILAPCSRVTTWRHDSCRHDRIECHFSALRKAVRLMQSMTIADSLKVTIVHFVKDGEFGRGMIRIWVARGDAQKLSTSSCMRSSWNASMHGSVRACNATFETFTKH